MIGDRSAANLIVLVAGLVVWSSAFVALYALLSIGCAFGWEDRDIGPISLQRAVLIGVWLLHLAILAGLVRWTWRRTQRAPADEEMSRFFARTALAATVVSVAVTIVNYAPILGLSACL
ncbi:hypothetical protein ACLNGM_12175 [Aureimonas phyllosphaerae]|uniref:hypothetical protein n=1 Tax=Aureimonas phyllosphaerae TaxID=1166078 RepID=UPI003A5BAE0E